MRVLAQSGKRIFLRQERIANNVRHFHLAGFTLKTATRMTSTLALEQRSQLLNSAGRVAKIAVAIVAVMAFALGVLSVMALEKFKGTLKEVTESRIGVIAFDVQDNIEQGLALGINLPALENVQESIRRAKARDVKVTSIYVIGRQGETLYRVPETALQLTDEAVEKFRKGSEKGGLASLRDGNSLNVFLPLQNSFSQTQGILLLKYDASSLDDRYLAFRATFFRQVLFFLLAGASVATLAIWILLRKHDAMDAVLAKLFEPGAEYGDAGVLKGPLGAFRAKETEAMEAIAAAEKVILSK